MNFPYTMEGFEQSIQEITGGNLTELAFYMTLCTDTELLTLLFDYINDLIGDDSNFDGQKAVTYMTLIYFIRMELKNRGLKIRWNGVEV